MTASAPSGIRGALVAVIEAEALIFSGNGRRCLLTAVVERIGTEHGSVTDIFLPRPIAMHIFELTAPLFVLGIGLNARTLITGR